MIKIEYYDPGHFFPNPPAEVECYDCILTTSNGMRFQFNERDGFLEIHVDGLLLVFPSASNAIRLKKENFSWSPS